MLKTTELMGGDSTLTLSCLPDLFRRLVLCIMLRCQVLTFDVRRRLDTRPETKRDLDELRLLECISQLVVQHTTASHRHILTGLCL